MALIILLGSGTGSSIANTLLAILAAAGVSAAGVSAKRFRQDLFTDLTTNAITIVPSSLLLEAPREGGKRRQQRHESVD